MQMTCPKCGSVQPTAPVCAACGVFIQGYLERNARPAGKPARDLAPRPRGVPHLPPDAQPQESPALLRPVVLAVLGAVLALGLAWLILDARSSGHRSVRPVPATPTPSAQAAPEASVLLPETPVVRVPSPEALARAATPEPTAPPPPISGGGRAILAPAPMLDLVAGGGGRFLVCRLAGPPYLAVFDVVQETWTPLRFDAGEDARLAADADRLYVSAAEPRQLWALDLATLRPLTSAALPGTSPVRRLAAGSNARGPLLLVLEDALWLLDRATLEPVMRRQFIALDSAARQLAVDPATRVLASADGNTFTLLRPRDPAPGYALHLEGEVLRLELLPAGARYAVPDAAGRRIYTDQAAAGARVAQLPEASGRFLLEVREGSDRTRRSLRVLRAGDGAEVYALSELNEFGGPIVLDKLRFEQRFHLLPELGKLLTIPPSEDRIVIRALALPAP
ncbi:MAG TPA: hypothetical protein VM074_02180 [Solimonas sp.]|nr:hypothetical protein [Solimonas sp.]